MTSVAELVHVGPNLRHQGGGAHITESENRVHQRRRLQEKVPQARLDLLNRLLQFPNQRVQELPLRQLHPQHRAMVVANTR